jgi:hypothetical protein
MLIKPHRGNNKDLKKSVEPKANHWKFNNFKLYPYKKVTEFNLWRSLADTTKCQNITSPIPGQLLDMMHLLKRTKYHFCKMSNSNAIMKQQTNPNWETYY